MAKHECDGDAGDNMISSRIEADRGRPVSAASLDEAHIELVDLCARIDRAGGRNATATAIRERIRTFLMYARWHFAEEEEWMRTVDYPHFLDHKSDHSRLLQDAEDFVLSFGPGLQHEDGPAVASYFRFWLKRHMAAKDRAFRSFIDDG